MLEDLDENSSYEVLKRTAEHRSAWRESTRKFHLGKQIDKQHTLS